MQTEARAPGKVILFGEHAINRGQPALAASVGLYATCRASDASEFSFASAGRIQRVPRAVLLGLREDVEHLRASENYEGIRALARHDYFAPQKYVLASAFDEALPEGLRLEWESAIPSSSGLGSGGAAFTAMVSAILPWLPEKSLPRTRAAWAQLGDIIAHGGIASGLDTQASLLGGVICFTGHGLAERIDCPEGASLLIANTGIAAATSEVNTRVRLWLAEKPASRLPYFHTIGALSRAAIPLLQRGDWDELGRLMNLNQLVLERIGVSCPEIDRLIESALAAGAYGAKISGSGGGGIVIVLAPAERTAEISAALTRAGGSVIRPPVAVPGAAELPPQVIQNPPAVPEPTFS